MGGCWKASHCTKGRSVIRTLHHLKLLLCRLGIHDWQPWWETQGRCGRSRCRWCEKERRG